METPPQMRVSGLNVFTAALRCVPYIVPEHWTGSRLMEDLPGKASLSVSCRFISKGIERRGETKGRQGLTRLLG